MGARGGGWRNPGGSYSLSSAARLHSLYSHRKTHCVRSLTALFEIWYKPFPGPALLAKVAREESLREALGSPHTELRISLVEKPDSRLGNDPVAARNEAVVRSLLQVFSRLRAHPRSSVKGYQ